MYCHRCGANQVDQALFCSVCGIRLRSFTAEFKPLESTNCNGRTAISHYFNAGFRYESILSMLEKYHGWKMSLRTLKRRLADYGLTRTIYASEVVARRMIERELRGPSSQLG